MFVYRPWRVLYVLLPIIKAGMYALYSYIKEAHVQVRCQKEEHIYLEKLGLKPKTKNATERSKESQKIMENKEKIQ